MPLVLGVREEVGKVSVGGERFLMLDVGFLRLQVVFRELDVR